MRIAIFILILLVVTGIVAAAGDRMGHLAARRKIRFGGMRPRNVSTLIAVTTGILIAAVTFILIFALSADFRDSFLKYDEIKRRLSETQQQLDSQQRLADQARSDAQKAQQQAAEAMAEIAAIEEDVSRLRGEKVELAMALDSTQLQLDETNELLASREREVAAAETRKRELDAQIKDLDELVLSIFASHRSAISEIEQWEGSDIAIPVGTYLDYILVTPATVPQLSNTMNTRVRELTDKLEQLGFTIDTATTGDMQHFIASDPFGDGAYDIVIIITTARNVLSGGEVRLSFKAKPLTSLVKVGDEIMDVLVDTSEARVNWRGEEVANLAVPEVFDQVSFAGFAEELWGIFNNRAIAMGFLPDMATGEVPNPIEALAGIYDNLAERERPFVIQFVSKGSAHALDGLAGCEIYISNWPPER